MSRWAETFAALSGGSDTVDTLRQNGEWTSIVSHSVQSVRPPPEPAATPHLPATERASATWREAEADRAAIIEHDGKIPRAWAEGFVRLDPDRPPANVPPRRWRSICDAISAFLDCWGAEAARLGWTAHDLFGADGERPEVTWLNSGPLWSGDGARVVELDADRIVFETRAGARQTAPRRPPLRPRLLPWEI